jgi:hypothetical protein
MGSRVPAINHQSSSTIPRCRQAERGLARRYLGGTCLSLHLVPPDHLTKTHFSPSLSHLRLIRLSPTLPPLLYLLKRLVLLLSSAATMLGQTLLVVLAAGPQLVLGQVLSCGTADTCFQIGPTVNFTQAALVIPNACVMLAGSFIHDQQRHYCAVNGPSPSE